MPATANAPKHFAHCPSCGWQWRTIAVPTGPVQRRCERSSCRKLCLLYYSRTGDVITVRVTVLHGQDEGSYRSALIRLRVPTDLIEQHVRDARALIGVPA